MCEEIQLPKLIQEQIDDHNNYIKHCLALIKPCRDAQAIVEAHPEGYIYMVVEREVRSAHIKLNYSGESLEDAAVILREMAKLGYPQTREFQDQHTYGWRTWFCGQLQLEIRFMTRGAKCQFVKTGTVTEDVMELQCTD